MSGFFARMGERAAGRPTPVRVRAPHRFEQARPVGRFRHPGLDGPASDPSVPPDPSTTPDLDVETVVDAVRSELPAVAEAAPRGDRRRAARPAPSRRDRPAADPHADTVDPPTAPPAPRTSWRDAPQDPSPEPPPAPREPAGHRGPPERTADPLRDVPPPVTGTRPPAEVPRTIEPDAVAGPPAERPGPTGPPPVAVPDVDDLVRRHVLPALVARGLAGPHETVEVITDAAAGPDGVPARRGSRPGRQAPTTLTVTPAHHTPTGRPDEQSPGRRRGPLPAPPDATAPAQAEPPQVHVHIDRVVVSRTTPPPRPAPAPPAPRGRSQPDHEAYLARRREGR